LTALWAKAGLFEKLRDACAESWESYVDHEFVRRLGDGTLPAESFKHYLVQDYLFLIHYARAWALASYKADDLAQMRFANESVKAILDVEMGLHVKYCESWGIPVGDIETYEESEATLAYTRFVLEAGHQGDSLDLAVALAPCALGYAEIAQRLNAAPYRRIDANPYNAWIDMYAGAEFRNVARGTADFVDRLWLSRAGGARFESLATIFDRACRLEAAFWRMGLERAV
jgi:thiaminase (transcriptional activator TenA)